MLPLKRIVCPTDFSEASYEGLTAANELALHFSAELILVHVIAPIPTVYPPATAAPGAPAAINIPSYQQELEESAKRQLNDVIKGRLPKEPHVRPLIAHGRAAEEIVRISDDHDTDLIVMSTHGQSGWRRIMFGSVAEKVVRLSTRPVLTIRAPEKHE